VEKAPVHIGRNSSALFDIIESPPTAEIAERSQYEQLHQRCPLVVKLWATLPGESIIFPHLFRELKKGIVWETESHPKLTLMNIVLKNMTVLHIHLVPQRIRWGHDLKGAVFGVLLHKNISTPTRPYLAPGGGNIVPGIVRLTTGAKLHEKRCPQPHPFSQSVGVEHVFTEVNRTTGEAA